MKYFKQMCITMLISLTLSSASMAMNSEANKNNQPQNNSVSLEITAQTDTVLTEVEETNLSFMREEEKLARDVYLNLFDLWKAKIFDNISRAEQSHMDSVKVILDLYNLTDPAPIDPGFFTDPELQELYNHLIAQGQLSLIEALKVGALIEEVDINDLNKAIDETDNPVIIEMYTNLLNGSYSHLNAFVSQLSSYGVLYKPKVLSKEEFYSILTEETLNSLPIDNLRTLNALYYLLISKTEKPNNLYLM